MFSTVIVLSLIGVLLAATIRYARHEAKQRGTSLFREWVRASRIHDRITPPNRARRSRS